MRTTKRSRGAKEVSFPKQTEENFFPGKSTHKRSGGGSGVNHRQRAASIRDVLRDEIPDMLSGESAAEIARLLNVTTRAAKGYKGREYAPSFAHGIALAQQYPQIRNLVTTLIWSDPDNPETRALVKEVLKLLEARTKGTEHA